MIVHSFAAWPDSERPPQVVSINRRSPYAATVEFVRFALQPASRDIRAFDPFRIVLPRASRGASQAGARLIDGKIQSSQRLFYAKREELDALLPLRAARRLTDCHDSIRPRKACKAQVAPPEPLHERVKVALLASGNLLPQMYVFAVCIAGGKSPESR
jgi:hypothetical protein